LGKNFIPTNDAEFNLFSKHICQTVTANTSGTNPLWPHIPQQTVTNLNSGYAEWYTSYAV
jgi:hypothetical protein